MILSDIMDVEDIVFSLKAKCKKQILQELSQIASKHFGIDHQLIFETLLQRERLGSTGLGYGVAIPHGKLAGIKGLYGLFAKLEKPVDFDAVDEQPVDMVFLLLAPENAGADHLKALALVSRILRNNVIANKLRNSENGAVLYSILTDTRDTHAA